VLIVESDLGFVFWLGQTLDKAGYTALPSKTVTDAKELLSELNVPIDLVVIDLSLTGALNFVHALRRSQGHLHVLALVGETEGPRRPRAGIDAWRTKPHQIDEISKLEWVQLSRMVLARSDGRTGRI
jgi:DNA-binding response OmpR family regulator